MAKQINLTFRDAANVLGTYGLQVDDSMDDGVYLEVLAHIQDILDASECHLEKAVVLRDIDIGALTNPPATSTGDFSRINDQAILTWQSAAGRQARTTIPAPLVELFDTAGPYLEARVNEGSTLGLALVATGEAILVASDGLPVDFRKGWRKGQKHP